MKNYLGVVALCVAAISLSQAHANTWDSLDLSRPFYGEGIPKRGLRGKVVFFEYWGTQCPPCRASFPKLVELQKKYQGRFQIVGSHVQSKSERTMDFLKDVKANFPIYQQLRPSFAPGKGGIPHAFLFDHTGKLIAQGHPVQLYPKVADAVKKAPGTGVKGSEVLGGLYVAYNRSAAKRITASSPVKSALASLKRAADKGGAAGDEAKEMIEAIDSWMQTQLEEGKKHLETSPSLAYQSLKKVAAVGRGLPIGAEADKLIAPLQKDPSIRKLIPLREAVEKLKADDDPRRAAVNKRRALSLRKQLDKLLATPKISDAVKGEIEALIGLLG